MREAREAFKAANRGRRGSQRWVADTIGAHFTSVSDWERGDTQPSARHLMAYAEAVGVPVEDLYVESSEVGPLRSFRDSARRPVANRTVGPDPTYSGGVK